MKRLEEKRVQVERPMDNFVQVFIGTQVAAIVHSNNVFTRTSACQKCHRTVLMFLLHEQ